MAERPAKADKDSKPEAATPRRPGPEVLRPRLDQLLNSPSSPRTPRTPGLGRSGSSNFGSPGLSFRQDDDYLVFELGTRHLSAGLGGEGHARCELRIGASDHAHTRPAADVRQWAREHELWQMDLQNVDLGLVGDKLDKYLQLAIRDYVLVLDDSKKRRAMVVLPALLPHPLISKVCEAIFALHPPIPTITLLSAPTMSAVAAGLRSALVVDIGWAECSVCGVYEYREVKRISSNRGSKLLTWAFRQMLAAQSGDSQVALEDVEEVIARMAWCPQVSDDEADTKVTVMLAQSKLKDVELVFSQLAGPVLETFFPNDSHADDEELGLPNLMFQVLLGLPVDVRETCLHHIVFTGGASNIVGLKGRALAELAKLINERRWDLVESYGSSKGTQKSRLVKPEHTVVVSESIINETSEHVNKDVDSSSEAPVHLQPPLQDPFLTQLRSRAQTRPEHGPASSQVPLRSYQSLGPWTGASLLAGLRIAGLVDVDRDTFVQHGLHARPEPPSDRRKSVQQTNRQSLFGPGAAGIKAGEHPTWTLGVWA